MSRKGRVSRQWTAEEDNYLLIHSPNMNVTALASMLGRTEESIRHRWKVLRKAKGVVVQKVKHWSAEDDAYLRKWTHLKTAVEIGKALGRTTRAVHYRRGQLGIDAVRRGQTHASARIRRTAVAMIKALHKAGFMPADIHRLCNTNPSERMVYDITSGRTWVKTK